MGQLENQSLGIYELGRLKKLKDMRLVVFEGNEEYLLVNDDRRSSEIIGHEEEAVEECLSYYTKCLCRIAEAVRDLSSMREQIIARKVYEKYEQKNSGKNQQAEG